MEDRLIIEDHACICKVIDQIYCALENNTPMPRTIPVLNDGFVTDQLSRICEELNKKRDGE